MGLFNTTFDQLTPRVGDAQAAELVAQQLARVSTFPLLSRERLNAELTAVAAWRQVAALERIASSLEAQAKASTPPPTATSSAPSAAMPTKPGEPIRLSY